MSHDDLKGRILFFPKGDTFYEIFRIPCHSCVVTCNLEGISHPLPEDLRRDAKHQLASEQFQSR